MQYIRYHNPWLWYLEVTYDTEQNQSSWRLGWWWVKSSSPLTLQRVGVWEMEGLKLTTSQCMCVWLDRLAVIRLCMARAGYGHSCHLYLSTKSGRLYDVMLNCVVSVLVFFCICIFLRFAIQCPWRIQNMLYFVMMTSGLYTDDAILKPSPEHVNYSDYSD